MKKPLKFEKLIVMRCICSACGKKYQTVDIDEPRKECICEYCGEEYYLHNGEYLNKKLKDLKIP